MKRASVDAISFNGIADTAKSLEIPSIKIESTSRFMSLDCVCEDSTESFVIEDHATNTGAIPVRQTVVRGHPRATRSESDPRSFSARNYVNPSCPEDRMDFYRTFSLLIKLGSLAHKQQESQKQQIHSSSVESQSSEENKKWKVELSQALWLELQAWHANRSMSEQDQYLMVARASVNEVLDEVINFKVKIEGKNSHVIEDGNDINCQSETVTLDGSSQEESTEFIEFTHNTECATNLTNGEQLTLSDGSDTLDGSESNDLRSLKATLHLDLSKTN